MAYEIVYTSTPQGLKDGDRGFCTVAATEGIPGALQEQLESLSAYRHAFAPPSDRNPVNFCYQVLRLGRDVYYVLSRIADAGIDYSGRNNKIAHHLALTTEDVRAVRSSPAALLADEEFWYDDWDGPPQRLPEGRLPRPALRDTSGCPGWDDAFGDAGWAGVLAGAIQDARETVSVIVSERADVLTLVNEALQLLPERDRWKACFSTYFTRSASGSGFHWRFLLDGSEEADTLRDRPRGIVVDPSRNGQAPGDSAFVIAARSGEVPAMVPCDADDDWDDDRAAARRPVTRSQLRRKRAGERARRARMAAKVRPAIIVEEEPPPAPQPEPPPPKKSLLPWVIAAAVVAVLLGGLAIAWMIGFR